MADTGLIIAALFLLCLEFSVSQTTVRFWHNKVATDELDSNMTLIRGEDAIMGCTMQTDEDVVWIDPYGLVLFYNEERIIDERRFKLTQSGSVWNLHISKVTPRDSGKYRCSANTKPKPTDKYMELLVYVPVAINKARSTKDLVASAGSNIYLACNASGFPEPTVTWKSRWYGDLVSKAQPIDGEGEVILIGNISKNMDVVYTCTASNAISEARHDIRVQSRFAPTVKLPNKTQYQSLGKSTVLPCEITGNPIPTYYWTKDGRELKDGEKYRYQITTVPDEMKIYMNLEIYNINRYDYQHYKCTAFNSLGVNEAYMELKPWRDGADILNRYPDVETTTHGKTKRQTTKKSPPVWRERTSYKPLSLTAPKPRSSGGKSSGSKTKNVRKVIGASSGRGNSAMTVTFPVTLFITLLLPHLILLV